MRSILLAVFVLGFAALGGAQTTPATPIAPRLIHYDSLRLVADVYQLRGDVRFQLADVTITADEADLTAAETREFTLRGNVRMVVPRSVPR